jgi:hypothetical protein
MSGMVRIQKFKNLETQEFKNFFDLIQNSKFIFL